MAALRRTLLACLAALALLPPIHARAESGAHGQGTLPSDTAKPTQGADEARANATLAAEYADYLFASWQFPEGIELAETAYRTWPSDAGVVATLAHAEFLRGNYARASELVETAKRLDPRGFGGLGPLAELIPSTEKVTRGFKKFVSPKGNFELFVKPGKDELLALYALDALDQVYERVSTDYGFRPPTPVRVEIYPHIRNLADVTTLTREDLQNTGTIALCKYNRLMAVTPRVLPRGYSWLDTLSHEFIHHVVGMKSHNTVPIWLQEGLARFQEGRWRSPDPTPLGAYGGGLLNWALKKPEERLVTFEQMSPSMAKLPSADKTALAFAEVHMAVGFMHAKTGYAGLQKLMTLMRDGQSDRAAVEAVSGMPFARFEVEWRGFAKANALPPTLSPDDLPSLFDFAMRVSAGRPEAEEEGSASDVRNKRAAQFVRLGEMLRERQRTQAALVEYTKAVSALERPDPIVHVKYARLLIDAGRLDAAEKVLLDVRKFHPETLACLLNLGRIYKARNDVERAIAHFTEALRENPFHPEIHAALFELYEAKGDTVARERERKAIAILLGEGERKIRVVDAIEAENGSGLLSVYGPLRSSVTINGKAAASSLPIVDLALAPGTYELAIQPDGESASTEATQPIRVTIENGKRTVVE